MENKRGQTTFGLIIICFVALAMLVILAIGSYGVKVVDTSISQLDFNLESADGLNQSFNETYQALVHPGMETLRTTAPKILSIGTFLGMILCLLLVGIKIPKKNNLWMLADIVIIIVAEIIAIQLSLSFKDYILNLSPELYDVLTTTLATSSKWILNLPTTIPTVGILVMIATYILRREELEETKEEEGRYF